MTGATAGGPEAAGRVPGPEGEPTAPGPAPAPTPTGPLGGRPEILVGAAFAGGVLLAILLRRLR